MIKLKDTPISTRRGESLLIVTGERCRRTYNNSKIGKIIAS